MRAAPALVPALGADFSRRVLSLLLCAAGRRHECRRGTHECVRQGGIPALAFLTALLPAPAPAAVDFATQIRPWLETTCVGCHGAAKALGGYRLDTREAALKRPLYQSVASGKMPPGGPAASKTQLDLLRAWVDQGAPWPAGLVLRAPAAGATDERATVEELHRRIVAGSKPTIASEMRAYKKAIPGTDVSFEMVPVPGGEFLMGTPPAERGRSPDEGPQHKMRIDPLWMGKFEVTWDEYRLFMFAEQAGETRGADTVIDAVSRPTKPYVEMSFGMGINGYPAISMTQHAANKYAEWLSARTGEFYRLPTEAEWEYACRAGTTTAYSFGDDPARLGEYAWFAGNSDGKYQKVGTKKPNPWGLYDMHGNVMEWTLDQYEPDAYAKGAAWIKSTKPYPQVARGGAWTDEADRLRCGARLGSDPSWKMQDPQLPKSIWYHTDAQGLGFRLVRPLKVPEAGEMFGYWNSGVEKE